MLSTGDPITPGSPLRVLNLGFGKRKPGTSVEELWVCEEYDGWREYAKFEKPPKGEIKVELPGNKKEGIKCTENREWKSG